MKQLTNNLLKINFSGVELANVTKIEFAFSQSISGSPLKIAEYPGNDTILIADSVIGIEWTKKETKLFEANKDFFLDTRITMKDSIHQPDTQIIRLKMNPTLFEE